VLRSAATFVGFCEQLSNSRLQFSIVVWLTTVAVRLLWAAFFRFLDASFRLSHGTTARALFPPPSALLFTSRAPQPFVW
jgi:hypothetical protein